MNAKIEACPRDGQDRDERPGSAPHWLTTAGRIPASGMLVEAAGTSLGSAVNLLAVAVLTGLPGLRVRPGRVLGPALLVAAGAVGLLIFLNVLNRLILFAAALTATSRPAAVDDHTPPAAATGSVHPTHDGNGAGYNQMQEGRCS